MYLQRYHENYSCSSIHKLAVLEFLSIHCLSTIFNHKKMTLTSIMAAIICGDNYRCGGEKSWPGSPFFYNHLAWLRGALKQVFAPRVAWYGCSTGINRWFTRGYRVPRIITTSPIADLLSKSWQHAEYKNCLPSSTCVYRI